MNQVSPPTLKVMQPLSTLLFSPIPDQAVQPKLSVLVTSGGWAIKNLRPLTDDVTISNFKDFTNLIERQVGLILESM